MCASTRGQNRVSIPPAGASIPKRPVAASVGAQSAPLPAATPRHPPAQHPVTLRAPDDRDVQQPRRHAGDVRHYLPQASGTDWRDRPRVAARLDVLDGAG